MRALTVLPGQAGSAAVVDMPEPDPAEGSILVDGLAVGICGTDAEINAGQYGQAPPGSDRLIIGHESLGRVREAPDGSGLSAGDLVVGIVRRPDPVPCLPCSVGEWDFCRNGQYTERGIKGRHGYASEHWRIEPEFAVRLDPRLADVGMLLEPTTVVAKAWEQIDLLRTRAHWQPGIVLVTGAGPIGLLAALLARQRGYEVHVLDHNELGPKRTLTEQLGATFHVAAVDKIGIAPDILIECTGVPEVVAPALTATAADGIACLTGVSSTGSRVRLDLGSINRELVLENGLVFGSVNANRRHYEQGAKALAQADHGWLTQLITRRVPLADAASVLTHHSGEDVKVVLELTE